MARMHKWIASAALVFVASGCVSQEKYKAVVLDRDRLAEQLGQAQAEARAARSEAEAFKNQIAAIMNAGGSKEAMILNLTQQNAELQRQLDELNRKYDDAVALAGRAGTALPAALSNELSAFAAANPDLVDFDAARGIVKFKSDVTFATGSAELTPKAREVIGRFSQILNSGAASGYELLVAGHTDNTRVVNPQTIAAGHKDNWYLSAHRAIGVGSALQGNQVQPTRIGCVGYAEYRPISSNNSDSGRAQNRRVEVLILPTTVRGGSAVTSTPKAAPKVNKDTSATIDARPAVNK